MAKKTNSSPTTEDFFNFRNEIHQELSEFKQDITKKIDDFKVDAVASINSKAISIKTEAWIVGILLFFILSGVTALMIQVNNIKNEQYYTKRVAKKTEMTVTLSNLKQSKINATFRKDTCEEKKLDYEIENYKKKINDEGYIVVETLRGVKLGDEKMGE